MTVPGCMRSLAWRYLRTQSGCSSPSWSRMALYATIAKTMVPRWDFVNLLVRGEDWLDKPHFLFWLMAISFSTFRFSTWAYKLPALHFYLGRLDLHVCV